MYRKEGWGEGVEGLAEEGGVRRCLQSDVCRRLYEEMRVDGYI